MTPISFVLLLLPFYAIFVFWLASLLMLFGIELKAHRNQRSTNDVSHHYSRFPRPVRVMIFVFGLASIDYEYKSFNLADNTIRFLSLVVALIALGMIFYVLLLSYQKEQDLLYLLGALLYLLATVVILFRTAKMIDHFGKSPSGNNQGTDSSTP